MRHVVMEPTPIAVLRFLSHDITTHGDVNVCVNSFVVTCHVLWYESNTYNYLPLSHSVAVRQCQSRAARHASCTILKWLTIVDAELGGNNLPRKYDSELWDDVIYAIYNWGKSYYV